MNLDKKEIAYRQAMTAIEMFFEDKDPVSVHTLAAAAYNIFRDLANNDGTSKMLLKQKSLEFVAPEYHKEWATHMNKFENFFKHADRDHQLKIEFNPEVTEFYLYDVALKMSEYYGKGIPMVNLFQVWFAANKLKVVWNDAEREKNREFLKVAEHFLKLGKAKFKEYFLPLSGSFPN